ncbi:MAG: FtsX-like permease family protein [Roseivirga sp.]|nr:FtsX-like permease family protein [Roseivirga sp.]
MGVELKKSQVAFIRKDLEKRGVYYSPLQEDVVDHICTAVEAEMTMGVRFKDAYVSSLQQFYPAEVSQLQNQTLKNLNSMTLLSSYLRTAFRNLTKHKGYTAINLLGLTTGLAICLLIFLFIRYELSYDNEHPGENLYRLTSTIRQSGGQVMNTALTGAPWGPVMVEEIPELLEAARFMKYRLDVLVAYPKKNQSYYESNLIWGDQSALQFFDLPLIEGDRESALVNPNSAVISEATARKFFGDGNAIGEILQYNNEVDLIVTGVMRDMRENVHFKADIIASFNTLQSFWGTINSWTIQYYYTYFKIQEGTDIKQLEARFPGFFEKHIGKEWTTRRSAQLQAVSDIHLRSNLGSELKANTNISYLYLLALIALIILCMACANFVNLNIARSLNRLREVGIRKVMGGLRIDLMVQFVIESSALVVLALLLSLFTASLLLPFFNNLLGKDLTLFVELDWMLVFFLLTIVIVVSLVAGALPGLYASSVKPVVALKGKLEQVLGKFTLRDALVLFQFSICICLIIAVGVIRSQQRYIMSKDLGYDQEQLLMLSTNNIPTGRLEIVKNELLDLAEVSEVSITSHQLAGDQPYHSSYVFSNAERGYDTLLLGRLHVDMDFIKTYSLELLAGRDYNPAIASDTASFLINETTVKQLGLASNEEAINLMINYRAQGENHRYRRTGRVIGVIKDFHFQSLHHEVEGFVMDLQPARAHFIACKIAGLDNFERTLKSIEVKMAEMVPDTPLDYFFMDDRLVMQYATEAQLSTLLSIATVVALIVALLGLVSLVSQMTAFRRKEIGVRKVLGASSQGIVIMISKRFVLVILISLLIAGAAGYFWMDNWLNNFSHRIGFPWYLVLLAGLLNLAVTLSIVQLIAGRAARLNPAKTLRYD